MRKHCAANERIKREYFEYLKHAQRCGEVSIDGAAKAIARFEDYTCGKGFKRFHIQQTIGFKKKIAGEVRTQNGNALRLSTQRSTLNYLRALFIWLAAQPGYKSRFSYADAEYFNLSEKDNRAAQKHSPSPFPSLGQAQRAIRAMPASTPIEQRDRALVAFTLMTGCRDRSLFSLKFKHVDLKNQIVKFDAREVETKFSKNFDTVFMPVSDGIGSILVDWIITLTMTHLWAPTDPLIPKTLMVCNSGGGFRGGGLAREHWTTANAVRRIFRNSFERVGLPYFHAHSFRHTLAQLSEQVCRTPEEMKAWSQNLGHEHVMKTFNSYGKVTMPRQAEIIRQLATPCAPPQRDLAELLRRAATVVEGQQQTKN